MNLKSTLICIALVSGLAVPALAAPRLHAGAHFVPKAEGGMKSAPSVGKKTMKKKGVRKVNTRKMTKRKTAGKTRVSRKNSRSSPQQSQATPPTKKLRPLHKGNQAKIATPRVHAKRGRSQGSAKVGRRSAGKGRAQRVGGRKLSPQQIGKVQTPRGLSAKKSGAKKSIVPNPAA